MTDLLTPLHGEHVAAGATLTPFAGWSMPLRYASELAEHRAVRERAGLFDLSHMAQIEVSGPTAASSLDHALVSRVGDLDPGRARYTMLTAPDGGILDDLIVYRLDTDDFLVVSNAANRTTVVDELTVRSTTGTHVDDRTEARALIAVQGPHSTDVLGALTATDLGTVRYYTVVETRVVGIPALLARTGYTGEVGYELSVPAASAVRLWRTLLSTGAVTPCGLASRDTLRLEAGMPLYGHELDRTVTPAEAGLARIVDLDHDFVGRDALAARPEPPARRLVGLAGTGRRAARAGGAVLFHEERVGTVTSGALSPTLGRPVALAIVDRAATESGTALVVDVRGNRQPMTVVDLPFYRRPRRD